MERFFLNTVLPTHLSVDIGISVCILCIYVHNITLCQVNCRMDPDVVVIYIYTVFSYRRIISLFIIIKYCNAPQDFLTLWRVEQRKKKMHQHLNVDESLTV
jgi:hypothetical protein